MLMKALFIFPFFLSLLPTLGLIHTVRSKETLWSLSKRYNVPVSSIKEQNSLSSDTITVGQNLLIDTPRNTTASKPTAQSRLLKAIQLQVTLDWAGFMPGAIDGKNGKYTRLAQSMCPSNLFSQYAHVPPVRFAEFNPSWWYYIDKELPLNRSGQPNFKKLTEHKKPMLYADMAEMIAERFHCTPELLQKLNKGVNFENLRANQQFIIPNVNTFRVEVYYSGAKREGVWSNKYGKGPKETFILVERGRNLLTLRKGSQVLASFPITVNKERTPLGKHAVELIAPGPSYKNKERKIELLPGPNSPVGILWCYIGDSIGIHGTNNPDRIGRNTSAGCIRLANWDIVRLARLIRKGTPVSIIDKLPPMPSDS